VRAVDVDLVLPLPAFFFFADTDVAAFFDAFPPVFGVDVRDFGDDFAFVEAVLRCGVITVSAAAPSAPMAAPAAAPPSISPATSSTLSTTRVVVVFRDER